MGFNIKQIKNKNKKERERFVIRVFFLFTFNSIYAILNKKFRRRRYELDTT